MAIFYAFLNIYVHLFPFFLSSFLLCVFFEFLIHIQRVLAIPYCSDNANGHKNLEITQIPNTILVGTLSSITKQNI